MRTALILLFLLAVAAIPGSILPQRTVDPLRVTEFFRDNPDLAPILDRLSLFDVFAAPWFAAIYLLLIVSLVGCIVPRTRQHVAAVRARPPATPRGLSRLPGYRTLVTERPPEEVLSAARRSLRGYRVDRGSDDIRAEKGYLRETGNLLFHVALVLLLAAFAVGKLVGYKGSILVVEGEGFANTVTQYDTFDAGLFGADLPPFSLRLSDFRAQYDLVTGAPEDFAAQVSYESEPDAPTVNAQIRVNHPLTIGGAKLFLGAHGYAAVVSVRDGNGDVAFRQAVPFIPYDAGNLGSKGVIKVPDALPEQLGFQGFLLPTAAFDPELGPVSTFPAPTNPRLVLFGWRGDLGLDSGVPQSVYRLETRQMTQVTNGDEPWSVALAPGEVAELPGALGSITFDGVQEWVNLDIKRDPGTTPALAAAACLLVGLVLMLSIRRRRVWVRARPDEGGRTVVEIGALAPTDGTAVDTEVERLARAIGTATDRPAGED